MCSKALLIVSLLALTLAQTPITPADYAANLGKGFDVTWSEFNKYIKRYTPSVPQHFAAAGFKNVRIRMNEQNPDDDFFVRLKGQVKDCLNNSIYPILAYQGHELEENYNTTDEDNKILLKNWWEKMAKEFAGFDYRLSFNVLVEISGRYKLDYDNVNAFYKAVIDAVRAQDPYRIVIIAPVKLSNPDYLQYLNFTEQASPDQYTMVQWHFYAAGPSTNSTNKKYWNDGTTEAERNNVLVPLKTAYNWGQEHNVSLWVGAWMAGNYNKGNDFDMVEQVQFGSFMARALEHYDMPWSINAGNKFYDYWNYVWFTQTTDYGGAPVRDAILNPDQISLYQQAHYAGTELRLGPGTYYKADLDNLGFVIAQSMMVPFDFSVSLFTTTDTSGTPVIVESTIVSLQGLNIQSIIVQFKNSYSLD